MFSSLLFSQHIIPAQIPRLCYTDEKVLAEQNEATKKNPHHAHLQRLDIQATEHR